MGYGGEGKARGGAAWFNSHESSTNLFSGTISAASIGVESITFSSRALLPHCAEAAKAKHAAMEAFLRRFGPAAARYCPPTVAALAPSGPSSTGPALGSVPRPLLAAAHRAAAAAAGLLSGGEGRKVDQLLLAAARRFGLPDASAFWLVGPRAAGGLPEDQPAAGFDNFIYRDPQKSYQQWKQLKAAREAGGAGTLPAGPSGSGGRGGRGGRAGRGGRGRGKQQAARSPSAAASAVASAAQADAAAGTAAAKKAGRGKKRQQAEASSSLEDEAEEARGSRQGDVQQQAQQGSGSGQRKRKGDLDEERALEAAMQASLADASTADANGTAASSKPSGGGTGVRRGPTRGTGAKKGEAGAAAAAAAAGSSRPGSATVNKRSPDAGLLWVEVYCRDEEGRDATGLAGRCASEGPQCIDIVECEVAATCTACPCPAELQPLMKLHPTAMPLCHAAAGGCPPTL